MLVVPPIMEGIPAVVQNHCTFSSSVPAELGIRERASTQELKLDPPAGLAQGNSWTNSNTTRQQSWETVDSKGTDPRTEPAQLVGFAGGRSWSPAVFPEPLKLAGAERSWMLGGMRQVKRLRSGRTGITF